MSAANLPPPNDDAGLSDDAPSEDAGADGGHRSAAPAWWPEGEAWPPTRRSGRHGTRGKGDWQHHGRGKRGRWRPFGCLFLIFGLFAAGTMVIGIWAAAAILGLVEAPAIVVGAGIVAFIVIALGAVAAGRAFRKLSQPLDELIEASGRIEAGDYGARVSVAAAARRDRSAAPSTR
jgi:membrane protein implicated in regulation of membrane protease activity